MSEFDYATFTLLPGMGVVAEPRAAVAALVAAVAEPVAVVAAPATPRVLRNRSKPRSAVAELLILGIDLEEASAAIRRVNGARR